jgi:aspartyl/asparaginyl beta-hydroxylase (cupin superfamily)
MKNFILIERNLPVEPLLEEIARLPNAWNLQTGRQRITVQREARAIPLRGLRKSKIQGRSRRDVHETRYTTLSRQFPRAIRFICEFATRFDSELARAKLVSLPSGNVVYPHVDRGEYYAFRNRFHFVLQSGGSWMRAGDEEVRMRTGELWWFDNKAEHEARNDGDDDRIHLIFDLEPRNGVLRPQEANEMNLERASA